MSPEGKVTFGMIGGYCEDLINDLFSKRISLENVRNVGNVIYADTGTENYPYISEISRKYGVRVRVKNRKGIYFRLRGLKKRPGLVLGIFVSAVMVLTLRLFIWHIDVHGNSSLSDEYILGLAEQYGFTAGAFANDTDALNAERNIMLSSDRIKWINIEVNGSRADIYLSENDSSKKPDVDYKTPCNIVASRAGVIVDTNVRSGRLMYEKGSGVAEGSVIVSGTVSSGESQILVHADAGIIADFTEEKQFEMAYTMTEKVPSEESFSHRQLMLFGIVIPLDGNDRDTENTICTEEVKQSSIFGAELPVKIRTDTYTRYKEVTVTRTSDDVRKILEQRLELYINNFYKEYEVLDINKSFAETKDGLMLKAVVKLRGDIAEKRPIYEH